MSADILRPASFKKLPSGLVVPEHRLFVRGKYHGLILRAGKVIDEFEADNLVVNQGIDYLLSSGLTGAAQVTAWFLAPFTGNYVPVASDTAASIGTNSTECTTYTSSTRPQWAGVESTQQATNGASAANFTFNAAATVYGAFLISSSTKLSTSGQLLSAAQFATPKSVSSGDQLLLTYTFNMASA